MDDAGVLGRLWSKVSNALREPGSDGSISIAEIIEPGIQSLLARILEENLDHEGKINLKDKEVLIKIILYLIENGFSIEELSEALDWFQFEYLCMKIMEYHNFDCKLHYCFYLEKKRFEIDILGQRDNLLLAVDVKHWSPRYGKKSALVKYAEKQEERVRRLIKTDRFRIDYSSLKIDSIIPVIVTWYDENILFYSGVPFVPVYKLNNFLSTLQQYDLKNIL